MPATKPVVKLLDFRSVSSLVRMLESLSEATLEYYRYWPLEGRRNRIKLRIFLYLVGLRILAKFLHRMLFLSRYFMYVAVLGGEVVAFLHLKVTSESSREAYFGMVVLDRFQGQGIGKMFLEECIKDVLRKGLRRINLEVCKENRRAIHLYKSVGFRVVDSSADAYQMLLDVDGFSDKVEGSHRNLRLLAIVNDPASGIFGCAKMFLTMGNILAERGHSVTVITRMKGLSGKSISKKCYNELLLEATSKTVWGDSFSFLRH